MKIVRQYSKNELFCHILMCCVFRESELFTSDKQARARYNDTFENCPIIIIFSLVKRLTVGTPFTFCWENSNQF